MTLKRLMLVLGILVVLAGVGIAWLWQYAYSPEGRARVIIAQLKGDTSSWRGWMLQHHLIRPGFSESSNKHYIIFFPEESEPGLWRRMAGADEMVKLGRPVIPIVIEALEDGNRDVRLMAIDVCGMVRDPMTIQPLAKCMRDDAHRHSAGPATQRSDDIVQCRCRDSLVEVGPDAFGALMESCRNCSHDVRFDLPRNLAVRWGSAALPQIIELLSDTNNMVRSAAADELGTFKDKRATNALIRALKDPDSFVVSDAAHALGEIRDPVAIPELLETLKNTHSKDTVGISAAATLARMGRDEGIQYLKAMMKSPSPVDRSSAARALKSLGLEPPPEAQPGKP